MKNWYAVYTKPQCEEKVALLLRRKGIETYCPLNLVEKTWWERRKLAYEPLFSSLVFVNIVPEEFLSVRQTNDVINFFYWLQQPVIIQDFEVEYIQMILSKHSKVALEKAPVCIYDQLNNESNSNLKQDKINIVKLENGKFKVILPSLGYTLITELNSIHSSHAIGKLAS